MLTTKKGAFADGHERADVVEYRAKFRHRMVGLVFLNSENDPPKETRLALSHDLERSLKAVLDKTVVIIQDESTF